MLCPPIHPSLPEVIEQLAPLERRAGSEGEAQAAAWLAERLLAAGADAKVEEAEFHDGYAKPIGALAAVTAAAGLAALGGGRKRRLAGSLAACLAGAAIADDVANTHRV